MYLQTHYRALRQAAGVVDRSTRGRLTLTGADRRSYLQGLLSNDIVALVEGSGCYATYLTAQGRMIADMRVFETGDSLLVALDGTLAESIVARWSQFVFSEDVRISNASASTAEIGVYGPASAGVVARAIAGDDPAEVPAIEESLRDLSVYSHRAWDVRGAEIRALASDEIGIRGFDLVVPSEIRDDVVARLERSGGVSVGHEAVEVCRIEGGRPLFRVDMNEDTIPLEAGIEDRAISLTKGCYVGQEVIIRVLHRGHGRVVRKLVGLVFEPGTPVAAAGAKITGGDREIGSITSAAESPMLGRPIALGYVHRDFIESGTAVTVDGQVATVAKLPFVSAANAVDRVAAE
ncbi:MAG TPA: glycine cleavage T C-terminal barrel domain-containing protein [Vicinamibacterales bacterium]|nr:glycine cleavage T C-terminal barrel domain-containing protein [Vicinamibacterales bacterium]